MSMGKGVSPSQSPTLLKRRPSNVPTIHTAANIHELRLALSTLDDRHTQVTSQLDTILASQHEFSRQIARVDLSRARLTKLSHSARAISHGNLASAAQIASRISAAVERLDLEQSRVKATLAVVEQVAELKACVLGVMGSMGAPQDWETAAEYLSRASRIPQDVVNSGFAEQVVPTAEVPDPPAATLDNAAKSLCSLFLREFEKAVETNDGARITRFFKMFPLIGRSKEGLAAYGKYVCMGVASRARQSMHGAGRTADGHFYATALTRLFEHIAQVVDGHSNLVERHYGQGTMVKVMERLHAEADVQGGIILDTWSDERTVDRKLTEVKSYAFTFLVQSFLNVPTRSGTPRPTSPAPGRKAVSEQQEEGIEMKEVDSILNDITAMLGHWSLYQRFVSSRAADADIDPTDGNEDPPLHIPPFLAESNLPKKVSKHLLEPFGTFATFFLRRSVEKAFQMDESPGGLSLNTNKPLSTNPPFITSAVDDVMYMVSQIIQRSLATSQGSLMTGVVATVGRVLGSDFIGMIQRKMRDESYPKAAIQGALPPEDKIIAFLVLINNLDIATEYIRRIVHQQIDVAPSGNGHGMSGTRSLSELFPMGREAAMVRQSLINLETGFAAKATELVNDGLAVAFAQIMKPRLRPLLNDIFRDVDYAAHGDEDGVKNSANNGHINEDDNDDDDAPSHADAIRTRFERGWANIIKPMKQILSERNSERLMTTVIAYLSGLLEKRIWGYQGRVSETGTLRLERNINDIANVALKGEHFKLREQFNRCFQIVTIMTMEEDEWDEVKNNETSDADGWVLNEGERMRARNMIIQ